MFFKQKAVTLQPDVRFQKSQPRTPTDLPFDGFASRYICVDVRHHSHTFPLSTTRGAALVQAAVIWPFYKDRDRRMGGGRWVVQYVDDARS